MLITSAHNAMAANSCKAKAAAKANAMNAMKAMMAMKAMKGAAQTKAGATATAITCAVATLAKRPASNITGECIGKQMSGQILHKLKSFEKACRMYTMMKWSAKREYAQKISLCPDLTFLMAEEKEWVEARCPNMTKEAPCTSAMWLD